MKPNSCRTYMVVASLILVGMTPPAGAQDSSATRPVSQAAQDSAFARARQLLMTGQTAAGQHIVDSILATIPPESAAYGNALYGKASLEPTAADAERDYQRIIVEYPLSTHAGDALLQLAQLERSQGKRGAAVEHLQRFLRENPSSPQRAQAGFWLAQLLFEQNDDQHACTVLDEARTATAMQNIELRNQIDFYTVRCQSTRAQLAADSAARVDSIKADSAKRAGKSRRPPARRTPPPRARAKAKQSAPPVPTRAPEKAKRSTPPVPTQAPEKTTRATPTVGQYSIQVGAFGTKAEAEKLKIRLRNRGLDARVDGTRTPYRVRIGRYETNAAARSALAQFSKMGIKGFVTSVEQP
jgi:cell division protein FtsN